MSAPDGYGEIWRSASGTGAITLMTIAKTDDRGEYEVWAVAYFASPALAASAWGGTVGTANFGEMTSWVRVEDD